MSVTASRAFFLMNDQNREWFGEPLDLEVVSEGSMVPCGRSPHTVAELSSLPRVGLGSLGQTWLSPGSCTVSFDGVRPTREAEGPLR